MIRVDHVTKRFGAVTAVDDVAFSIERGQIVGFLGPNGAGKSTLLKMMCTWLPPTSGTITIDGHDVVKDPLRVRECLGYLPEHNPLYEGMRVRKFFAFVGAMRGLAGAHFRERLDWVVANCSLEPVLGKWIRECSKGFRQRIGLAAALLHDPPVILLDEPTHGLDPLQVVAFRDFISSLRKDRAILFSSHILAEVVGISERLLVIQHGRLLLDDTVASVQGRAVTKKTSVEESLLQLVKSAGARE